MNAFMTRAAATYRAIFETDQKTELFLAKTYADVRRDSRLWGI